MRRQLWVWGFMVVGMSGLVRGADAQQTGPVGTIEGIIRDAGTSTPVPDVGVLVVGTNRASRTGPNGRYRIANVPVGTQQVRVIRLGYASQAKPASG